MIPRNYIAAWSKFAPWQDARQVEQDLIITKALLEIYQNPMLYERLAFRGGTALNKLFFNPAVRYSEDIDLVHTIDQPIGETVDILRSIMDIWLGEPKRSFGPGVVTLTYKILSNEGFPMKLKLEINNCEYFSVYGFVDYDFESKSSWSSGSAKIKSFQIEELLGTKLRALYQRRKGRDLFDLYKAINEIKDLDYDKIILCFHEYLKHEKTQITKKLFTENMENKLKNSEFCGDMTPLLPNFATKYDPHLAYKDVLKHLIDKI